MGRIFVMGLDGATWRVLDRFIEMGVMPTLKKLKEESAWGILESVTPPVSAPAWVTFMTGCNPGKHGIGDFYKMDKYGNPEPQGFEDIKIEPFWFHIKNHTTGIVNLPMTYPPPKINGFLISGFMSPEAEDKYTYPPDLQKEIEKIGDYKTDPYYKIASKNKNFLKKALEVIELREKIREYLLKKFSPELYIQIFQIPDAISHYFYDILDKNHPEFDIKGWENNKELVIEIFKKIDDAIKSWLMFIKDDDIFIILSDHGFTYTTHYFHLVPLLKEKGTIYLKEVNPFVKLLKRGYRSNIVQKYLLSIFPKTLFLKIKTKIERGLKKENLEIIIPPSSCYGIYVNKDINEERKKELINSLIDVLRSVEFKGKSPFKKVYLKEEIYSGPFINNLPDIVMEMNEGFEFSTSFTATNIFEKIPDTKGKGNHSKYGICLFYGKRVRLKGKIEEYIRLEDFAPFFLAYLGYKIPSYMDGKIPQFINYKKEPEFYKSDLPFKRAKKGYSEEEKESIMKKLKELGYA